MNFVVTGGAGFIGAYLVRRLLADGHSVTVVDNLSRGNISNLQDLEDKIAFVNVDISKYDKLKEALARETIDGIFHQAAMAYVPSSYQDEDLYRQVNVSGSQNVFKIGIKHGIKTIYASSSTVYGDAQSGPVNEESPRNPISPYGRTKLEAEESVKEYTDKGSKIIGLRYFNVVGLGRKKEYTAVIPRFLDRLKIGKAPIIYGDGLQIKDFVFVQDIVNANIAAMSSKIVNGFFNIGSGRPISIVDLARMMIKISKKNLEPEYQPARRGDVRMCVADNNKAFRLLNWSPNVSLEDGLKRLINS